MDNLTQELIDHIVSFVPRRDETLSPALPPFATISRKFQKAVERRTFRTINIKTTDADIVQFERLWSPRRRLNLRYLNIDLLVWRDRSDNRNELDRFRQADIEATNTPLRRLWNFLSSAWSELGLVNGNVLLILTTCNPEGEPPAEEFYNPRLYSYSPLDLPGDVGSFPALPFVCDFGIRPGFCHWHPRMSVVFASSMPNVTGVYFMLHEASSNWGQYYSIDKQCHTGLVQSIEATRLTSMKWIHMHVKQPSIFDLNQTLPKFIDDNTPDRLSCAIRELTRDCGTVILSGPFGVSLFDPPTSGPAAAEPACWQSTKMLDVKMPIILPDGNWLFRPQAPGNFTDLPEGLVNCIQQPPGYGDTNEERAAALKFFEDHSMHMKDPCHMFVARGNVTFVPDDEKMNTLLTAFARCCARMPELEVAQIRFSCDDYWWGRGLCNDPWPFVVSCVGPQPGSTRKCSVHFTFGDWRPTAATIAEFMKIGQEKYDAPCGICFH